MSIDQARVPATVASAVPLCPKCRAEGDDLVNILVVIIYDSANRMRTDLECAECRYNWSVLEYVSVEHSPPRERQHIWSSDQVAYFFCRLMQRRLS